MMKRIGMRRLAAFAAAAALVLGLVGCGGAQSTAQGNTEPVNLNVWTYYNGDQLESFNKLVDTFNDTVGKEKNITVESYSQGSVNDLEAQVMAAAQGKVGASAMPTSLWPMQTPPMPWTRWASWLTLLPISPTRSAPPMWTAT